MFQIDCTVIQVYRLVYSLKIAIHSFTGISQGIIQLLCSFDSVPELVELGLLNLV